MQILSWSSQQDFIYFYLVFITILIQTVTSILQKEKLRDGPHHGYQKSSEINQSSSPALSSKIITTQLKPSASSKYSCCQLAQQEQWRDKKLKSILLYINIYIILYCCRRSFVIGQICGSIQYFVNVDLYCAMIMTV